LRIASKRTDEIRDELNYLISRVLGKPNADGDQNMEKEFESEFCKVIGEKGEDQWSIRK
jgi:hypothetical protein